MPEAKETRTKPVSKWRRGWQNWQGHNTILFNGRVIGGPERGKTFRTLVLVGIPSILFLAFVGNKFWSEDKYVSIVCALLAVLSIFTLFKTAFTDPGIIPRKPGAQRSHPPRYQDLCINGRTVRLKYCQTCFIFRPPRSFHCPICENCVERFDHHCPWIGTCIGLRNYGWFTSFIWLTTTLCLFVLGHSIKLLIRTGDTKKEEGMETWERFKYACQKEPVAIFLVVYVFLSMWFVMGLCLFHTFLVAKNKTTNEQLRNFYSHGSPYSLGFFRNISTMCCKVPESSVHIHHKEPVPTETQEEIQKQMVVYVENLAATQDPKNGSTAGGVDPVDIVLEEDAPSKTADKQQPRGQTAPVRGRTQPLGGGSKSNSPHLRARKKSGNSHSEEVIHLDSNVDSNVAVLDIERLSPRSRRAYPGVSTQADSEI